MIQRRILAAVALLCVFIAPVHAQKTKAQLDGEIAANFQNNSNGAITPLTLRNTISDIVNSIMPTAPVVSGNLACFNGTTGLLQDCGLSPATVSITVGVTAISSGTPNGLLYDSGGVLGNLATANSGVLVTSPGGVPSISGTLPNGLALGTPASVTLSNGAGLPLGSGVTGTLQAANFPALTGDVATSAGSLTTTLANAPVIAKVLTGFTSGAGTVTAADSILSAIQKVYGNDALKLPLAGGTMSGNIAMGGNNLTGVGAITAATYNGGALSGTFSGTPTLSGANYVTLANIAQDPTGFSFLGNTGSGAANYAPFTVGSLTLKSSPVGADTFIIADSAASGALKQTTISDAIAAVGAGVTSIGTQTGAMTIPGGNLSSAVIPVPRYDVPQSLGIIADTQVQANINLPSIHRRPLEAWLPKWGAARANVLAGVSNAKLLMVGDSTFAGTCAQPSNVNVAPFTFPAQLALQLTANGLNASWQSRWSDNNFTASGPGLAITDSRVTMGAWIGGGNTTLGGALLQATATGSPFTFTPTTSVDSFDVYYPANSGQGTITLSINGGSGTAVSENGTFAMNKVTKTGTLGAGTLTIQQSVASVFMTGIIAYNSAVKEVSVINAGSGSAVAGTFTTNTFPFSALNVIGFLAPDLTIIDLTINDAAPPTALSTYQANLQTIITEAKISGDVILLGGVPSVSTYATIANQTAINNMAAALAAKNSINYISMIDLWGSSAAIITASYGCGDGIHLNQAGYAAEAALIAPYLQ